MRAGEHSYKLMAHHIQTHSLIIFLIIIMSLMRGSHGRDTTAYYTVTTYGANGNARTDSTQAFQRAWSAACASTTPATLYIPRGTYLLTSIRFRGPCRRNIVFRMEGTLIAPSNYWAIGSRGFWIIFHRVSGLIVNGGTLDARAHSFWACRSRSTNNCPGGANSLSFMACSNVLVNGVTSKNSQTKHITLNQSYNVRIQNVRIYAPSWSPNTDGIYTQYSTGVTITKTAMMTGDDCIAIGPGSRNMMITRIACGPGHGISIGSLGQSLKEAGVSDITVTGAVMTGTTNGLRIKSWGRPSNGFVRNVAFRNIVMRNVYNPIIIDQMYCPGGPGSCPRQSSGVKISGVRYGNIRGSSAVPVAVSLGCSGSSHCTGIELRNIALTYRRGSTTSYCKNAHGTSRGVMVPRSCL